MVVVVVVVVAVVMIRVGVLTTPTIPTIYPPPPMGAPTINGRLGATNGGGTRWGAGGHDVPSITTSTGPSSSLTTTAVAAADYYYYWSGYPSTTEAILAMPLGYPHASPCMGVGLGGGGGGGVDDGGRGGRDVEGGGAVGVDVGGGGSAGCANAPPTEPKPFV